MIDDLPDPGQSRATAPSARGLFKATGKTASRERQRDPLDFDATPPDATRAFLAAEGDRLRDFPVLWEPACGDGAMTREIAAAGHAVLGTDIVQRGAAEFELDFFDVFDAPARAIVTNPPYNRINWRDGRGQWVWHAMETLDIEYMALLLSWDWPGASGHGPLLRRWPISRAYLCRWKIDFTGEGSPPMRNFWAVWDRQWHGETVIRYLDRPKPPRKVRRKPDASAQSAA